VLYHHFPNSLSDQQDGSFTAEDVRRGLVALHTDYECPFCGRWQSVPQMGGYGGRCIQCGKSGRNISVTTGWLVRDDV